MNLEVEKYKVVESIDLNKTSCNEKSYFPIKKKESYPILDKINQELYNQQYLLYANNSKKILITFQAMDTAGKDGSIRSLASGMDPHGVKVHSFKKPTSEELEHDFLWRIHKKAPRNGQITIFNRSHYEDIIAVRVRKIYPKQVWQARYQHIINYEKMLSDEGTTIIKIFLHISKTEQKQRLLARLNNPKKQWKFNSSDLSDRAQWDDFQIAYQDVINKTSIDNAPWYVVPADRKWYRNLVLNSILLNVFKNLKLEIPKSKIKAEDFKFN